MYIGVLAYQINHLFGEDDLQHMVDVSSATHTLLSDSSMWSVWMLILGNGNTITRTTYCVLQISKRLAKLVIMKVDKYMHFAAEGSQWWYTRQLQ